MSDQNDFSDNLAKKHNGASSWMSQGFSPWTKEEDEVRSNSSSADLMCSGCCKVVVRCRQASSQWEHFVKVIVGNPVHLDVVLAKEGSQGARFCYSSYMNQKFEMVMMDRGLIHDKNMSNLALDLTEDEHSKCTKFLMSLQGKASYDYFDAMVLMPMAPKRLRSGAGSKSFASSVADILVEDQDATNPDNIKKVFCSQSVVLMLRNALDPEGRHAGLLATLNQLNSRLVSPKQVDAILRDYGAVPLSNEELSSL